ncbi:putative Short-chain dehydrogenase/reductase SDR [Seiridium unicorne]|uniref:Short-chain dehydrogenase/reductase SDR n=1 Tax=Seiridium unicorne TaxID=138068 RepID=A0ABR2URQ8_9PEZI
MRLLVLSPVRGLWPMEPLEGLGTYPTPRPQHFAPACGVAIFTSQSPKKMTQNKKVIPVTGATSGIGYETVAVLSTASFDFHWLTQRLYLSDPIRRCGPEVNRGGQRADPSTIRQTGRAHQQRWIIVYHPADMISAFRQSFEANVFNQMLVTETLEPLLEKSRTPYVIYVSSETGSITTHLDPTKYNKLRDKPYRISKSALNMLATCHRHNYGE